VTGLAAVSRPRACALSDFEQPAAVIAMATTGGGGRCSTRLRKINEGIRNGRPSKAETSKVYDGMHARPSL
jgi:hypothetical protein